METTKGGGRTIGALVLVQMTAGLLVNFVLLGPVFAAPGFLANAAAHSSLIGLSALLGIAMGSLSVAIAITAFPVFRQHSQALALWFVALAVVSLSVTVVENINLMSLLSLSEAYAKANAVERDLFPSLRVIVAAARNWTHYIGLIIGGITLLVFYSTLYRFILIPRAIAAFGLVANRVTDYCGCYASLRARRCFPYARAIGCMSAGSCALADCEGLARKHAPDAGTKRRLILALTRGSIQ